MTWVGGLGAVMAALRCFIGLLPFLLGVVGLSSLTATLYRDSVVFPIPGMALLMLGAGLWLKTRQFD